VSGAAAAEGALMIVDDDPDIRDVLTLLLEARGYHVVTASDGADAWEKIEDDERPALILLDLMMPRMDGEQFLLQLRARHDSNIPVVILSGHPQCEQKADVLHANAWLAKPVDLGELLEVVHGVMNHRAPG
jgi:DNA-binding response OmpR family regulator